MFNLLITIILCDLICNYIFGKKPNTLNCGIFAWVGVSSDKFSPFLFNVLGMMNDSRGGDSSGVYFNKNTITGIRADAKYEKLVKSQKLHTTLKLGKNPIVIGHCRKASVGSVIEANIQPVLLRNPDKGDKLVYVQAHNGTITNSKELAKKYNVTHTFDESDSVIMAKIIERKGFDVLMEYEGSAALVMYFIKEPNTLYAFHGMSKNYAIVTEERPLHYITIDDVGTYISSEAEPLEFISNGGKASSFKHNMVYKLVGDTVEEFKFVDREKAIKKEVKTYSSTNYDYSNSSQSTIPWKSNRMLITNGITRNVCSSNISSSYGYNKINNKIRYHKGFYWIGENYANGQLICDPWGFVRDPKTHNSKTVLFYLYFVNGILMKNEEAYNELTYQCNVYRIHSIGDFYTQGTFNLISKYLPITSLYPYTRFADNPGTGYMQPTESWPNETKGKKGEYFFTGSFSPLFTDYCLHFDTGDFVGYERLQGVYNLSDLIEDNPDFEDKLFFGKSPTQIKELQTVPKIESCDDCLRIRKHLTSNDCINCDKEFKKGLNVKDTKPKTTGSCYNCGDQTCGYVGYTDMPDDVPCESWIASSPSNQTKTDKKEARIELCQSIASQLQPVVESLEDLIQEIEYSGNEKEVENELIVINESTEKLKTILQ